MAQTVIKNNRGFTLVESIIAILLLSLLMLWTMQSMFAIYDFTSRNHLRDEAVRLAGEELTKARNTPYASLSVGTTSQTIDRQIRNYDATYSIDTTVATALAGLAYSVEVDVQWAHKKKTYSYAVSTIVGDK